MVYTVQFLPPTPIPEIDQAKADGTSAYFGFTQGPDGGLMVYKELLESERSYMNFLNVFDEKDMDQFLAQYDKLSEKELKGFATKEQLQGVFAKLAALRSAQADLLAILQEPDPQLWATKYASLARQYQDYIELAGGLEYPPKVDQCLALESSVKPFLSNILIKPIQRGTKVEMLIFDLIKKTPNKAEELKVFSQSAIAVNQGIQKGLELKAIRDEKNQFESLITQYNKKLKAEIWVGMIDRLEMSSLTIAELQGYFSRMSLAKLPSEDIEDLKQRLQEKITIFSERVASASTEGLKGKELTTQENDIRRNQDRLNNIQAIASFFEAKVKKEKNANAVVEPRVAKEAFGDIRVDIPNQDTQNRQAVKALLREGLSSLLTQGANANKGYHIVETQKKMKGKTASFVLKDVNNVNLLQVVVLNGSIRIRELQSDALDADSKIALMHSLATTLNIAGSQATVTSEHVEKVRKLNELSVNDGQKIYVQKADGKKALYKQIESDSAGHTVGKIIPAIKIGCQGNTPDQIRDKFQAVVTDGSFVPELVYQAGIPVPILNFNIEIASETPLVAIKQYESALNAGMKPVFTADAKRKVDSYVKKQMDINNEDKQIAIIVPLGSISVSGAQVLERVKQASKDGFFVNLSMQAGTNLKEHINTLKSDDPALRYELPLDHPHAGVMVTNLLSTGLLPNMQALKDKEMVKLREIMREEALQNNLPIVIDSGNIARDFVVLKSAYEDLGRIAKVSEVNLKALRNYASQDAEKGKLPEIDLKNISSKEQIACAQRMAQLGIYTRLTTSVEPGQPMFIRSKNPEHARMMFENYLNQGFTPHIYDKRVVELSKAGAAIKIEGNDPKVIFARMRCCAEEGLKVVLSPEQKEIMIKFSEKNNPQLPIHGHGWDAVKHNIELANQLGMSIKSVTKSAQAAYVREQALAKQKGQDKMPQIGIIPIQKTESRFLRGDRRVNDRDKTLSFAQSLINHGINISTAGLSVMKEEIKMESTKTKWFGLSKTPTAKAQAAGTFLKVSLTHLENNVQSLSSAFTKATENSLQAAANTLSPPVDKPAPKRATTSAEHTEATQPQAAQPQSPSTTTRHQPLISSHVQKTVVQALQSDVVNVASVIALFKDIRKKALEDFKFGFTDTYQNPGRVNDNADRIISQLERIHKLPAAEQRAELAKLLDNVAKGDKVNAFGMASSPISDAYQIDNQIKKVAEDTLRRDPSLAAALESPTAARQKSGPLGP